VAGTNYNRLVSWSFWLQCVKRIIYGSVSVCPRSQRHSRCGAYDLIVVNASFDAATSNLT
jgi:hypothetical protein